MANGTRAEQLGNIGAGLLKLGAGALRAQPGRGRIAPTLGDRFQGALGATRAVQQFEAGRAGIENIQAQAGLRETQTDLLQQQDERLSRPIDVDDAIRQFGIDPDTETGQFVKGFIDPLTDPNTNTVEMRDAFDALQRFNNTPTAHTQFFQKRLLDADANIKKQADVLQKLLEKAQPGKGTIDINNTEEVRKIVAGSNDIKLSSALIDFQRAVAGKQQVLSKMGAKQQEQPTFEATPTFEQIAFGMFGRTPDQLTPQEVQQVTDKIQEQEIKQREAQGFATASGRLAAEINQETTEQLLNLGDIENLFNEDFVGPVTGRASRLKSLTGLGLTEELAEFNAAVDKFGAELKRFYFGTAQTATELKNSLNAIPRQEMPPKAFRAAVAATRRNILNKQASINAGTIVQRRLPANIDSLNTEQAVAEFEGTSTLKKSEKQPFAKQDELDSLIGGQ